MRQGRLLGAAFFVRAMVLAMVLAMVSVVVLAALAKVDAAAAAGAVAIGQPEDIARDGVSAWMAVNYATTEAAQAAAVSGCKTVGSDASKALCKVVATYSNQCAASALDPQSGTPGFGWAIADSSEAAAKAALAKCRETAGPTRQDACVLGGDKAWCDGSAK